MLRKLDSPVRTHMAFAVFKSPCNGEYKKMDGKPPRRRRIFVQTETGCVLGMELDRGDNAHTVKRKMQIALNVPTEESSLTFGDRILNSDLSAIGNDSALLLTRSFMHRSSSTPCLSPRDNSSLQQRDQSGPVEILGCSSRFAITNDLVKDIVEAMKMGIDPIPVQGGLGGAYYFRNIKGENVAIVKPTDEEPFAPNNPKGFVGQVLGQPGLKRSVRVGETGFREVAAYLLDCYHFANVPPTVLVKITHSIFNVNDNVHGNKFLKKQNVSKIASLQKYIPHDFDASDHGTSSFPVAAVHRIGILDIRILNTDRHSGNLLVKKLDGDVGRFDQVELIPIDHGLCLPESVEDPYFEWIHWPQASIPFSEDEVEYIKNLDPIRDSDMLRTELPMIREACLRVLVLCTIFLKEATAFGLCLSEIGEMMSREFSVSDEAPSELEVVCLEARSIVAQRVMVFDKPKNGDEEFQFDLDGDDTNMNLNISSSDNSLKKKSHFWGFNDVNEDPAKVKGTIGQWYSDHYSAVSKLTLSLNKFGLNEKSQRLHGAKSECGNMVSTMIGARSANENQTANASFVKLADMSDEDWTMFLEKFKELLHPAFTNRKSAIIGHRLKQRLGTSY